MNDNDKKGTEQNMRIFAACRKEVEARLTEHGTIDTISDNANMPFLLAAVDVLVSGVDSTQIRDLQFLIGQLRHWGFGR